MKHRPALEPQSNTSTTLIVRGVVAPLYSWTPTNSERMPSSPELSLLRCGIVYVSEGFVILTTGPPNVRQTAAPCPTSLLGQAARPAPPPIPRSGPDFAQVGSSCPHEEAPRTGNLVRPPGRFYLGPTSRTAAAPGGGSSSKRRQRRRSTLTCGLDRSEYPIYTP